MSGTIRLPWADKLGLVSQGDWNSWAVTSPDDVYRYCLGRMWDDYAPPDERPWWERDAARFLIAYCMLNPSKARHDVDDPTIRKCVGFARRLGAGGFLDPADALGSALDWKERLRVDYASPSTMLELSRGLAVRQNSEVRNEHNLNAGTAQIFFATSHVDTNGQPLDIPAAVLLAMPVFKRGDLYQVPCRLRYRVDGPRVIWRYELARLDAVFEHAFAEALDLVRTGRAALRDLNFIRRRDQGSRRTGASTPTTDEVSSSAREAGGSFRFVCHIC